MAPEVRMVGVDAGIEHRPDDVLAEGGEGVSRGVGLDGAHRLDRQPFDLEIRPDLIDRLGPSLGLAASHIRAFPIAPDQFLDQVAAQSGEDVLLAEFGLASIDALLMRIDTSPFYDVADQVRDKLPCQIPATQVFQVDIDNDIINFSQAILIIELVK